MEQDSTEQASETSRPTAANQGPLRKASRLRRVSLWVGMIANVGSALALVFAVVQLRTDNIREMNQRRFEIYNNINDQYVGFVALSATLPWVDCYDIPLEINELRKPSNEKERREEAAAFASLISLLERAYVFYQRELAPTDSSVLFQWPGWHAYAVSFAKRDRFKHHWGLIGEEFDTEFQAWMDSLIKQPVK